MGLGTAARAPSQGDTVSRTGQHSEKSARFAVFHPIHQSECFLAQGTRLVLVIEHTVRMFRNVREGF